MIGDIVVSILAGDYFVENTIFFNEADSGSNGYEVIYKAAEGAGTVRLIGGKRVSSWTRYSGNIFQAHVPIGLNITTLYEDGVRADEARFPNRQNLPSLPTAHSPYLISMNPASSSTVLTSSGDLPSLSGDLSSLKVFIWSGHDWFTDILPVANINPALSQITLSQEARYPIVAGSRYFIEGALSLLDAPGEFFQRFENNLLYYWPRGSEIK